MRASVLDYVEIPEVAVRCIRSEHRRFRTIARKRETSGAVLFLFVCVHDTISSAKITVLNKMLFTVKKYLGQITCTVITLITLMLELKSGFFFRLEEYYKFHK